ncbi:putative cop9 signalosome complex subunit [Leptomonas pyrrhocoris]|uniref:Putative cop9 signalosome complex subunit n=1 Tax=Leptomonas pyrrhocoris TaxID=157538 RepID=A0A0M9G439_LEPPY|nr:putative cop9 signalosome complex subunit [Leptomonas pyrrhocoris]KPA81843.1 putative cop9 signalosome complex subunit [Leptomonas pyrrhocoris]|eukprot:XP_015660282.1 putative cop9 signalosome complex subunit [Leptomonas pyrrhocoris]
MASTSSFCWDGVDRALERGDAKGAASVAQEGLRAVAYDERRRFFTQLCTVLLRHTRTSDGAVCVAEAGELLWMMPEVRSSSSATTTVSGETLLLAAALATANVTLQNYEKVLVFDRELLQSPAFFTYDGFTAIERLACVARILVASRMTDGTRYVDSAVHKGMSLYHGLVKSCVRLGDAAQRQRDAVVCAYLFELACYRQKQNDYVRAFQSFLALHDKNKQTEVLCRAALAALCIRAGEGVRQGALHDVLLRCSPAALPSLYPYVQQAYSQQLFRAADTAAVLAAAGEYVPTNVLRDALREHNILLLAKAFDCVYWRSLCVHMDDDAITEGELYDLLVSMVHAQRLPVAIHQDTGFIEFGEGQAGARQRVMTDADVFNRIAKATAVIAAARPDLLS